MLAAGPQNCDAYDFAGRGVLLYSADVRIRRLMTSTWSGRRVRAGSVRNVQLILRVHDRAPAVDRHLRGWRHFVSDTVVFISDGKRYFLTGYSYGAPWQFDVRALGRWDPTFVYYHVLEPLLLDALKRLGVLVWHSASVERDGGAIVMPGRSGHGKSTTVLNLLTLGCRFIADDVSVLHERRGRWRVTGADAQASVYLGSTSYQRLAEWRRLSNGGRTKRGSQWKHRVDVSRRRSPVDVQPRIRLLLFPTVVRRAGTSIERLTSSAALLECLAQRPTEFPASILGPAVIDRQFEMYSRLVEAVPSYRILLGRDQDSVRAALAQLIGRQR